MTSDPPTDHDVLEQVISPTQRHLAKSDTFFEAMGEVRVLMGC